MMETGIISHVSINPSFTESAIIQEIRIQLSCSTYRYKYKDSQSINFNKLLKMYLNGVINGK